MKTKIDGKKILFAIIALVVAVFISFYAQPLIHDNDQAVNVIVTVFSILSGFLVAIIAIIGDPMLLTPGSWRAAEMGSAVIHKRLLRHQRLFVLYLITLLLIFVSTLLKKTSSPLCGWIERIYLFFSAVAFLFSLWLPSTLMNMQKERIEKEIDHRRKEAGIKPDSK